MIQTKVDHGLKCRYDRPRLSVGYFFSLRHFYLSLLLDAFMQLGNQLHILLALANTMLSR